MKCPACGNEIPHGAATCVECQARLASSEHLRRPRLSGLAVAAFIISLPVLMGLIAGLVGGLATGDVAMLFDLWALLGAPIALVGLILGIIAMRRTAKSMGMLRGRKLAGAAVLVCVTNVAFALTFLSHDAYLRRKEPVSSPSSSTTYVPATTTQEFRTKQVTFRVKMRSGDHLWMTKNIAGIGFLIEAQGGTLVICPMVAVRNGVEVSPPPQWRQHVNEAIEIARKELGVIPVP